MVFLEIQYQYGRYLEMKKIKLKVLFNLRKLTQKRKT